MMALYADAAHKIPLSNPVVADAEGMLPLIFLSGLALDGATNIGSSPFDCMASTADNRILWSYYGCKGFAWGKDAAALHISPIDEVPVAGTITTLTFDPDRDLLTLNLADQGGAPFAEIQLTAAAAKDLRRYLSALLQPRFSLPPQSGKPH
jgi:hypothetical protein